jgi:hypothetical protein
VGSILSIAGAVTGAAISNETVLNNSGTGNVTYQVVLEHPSGQTVGLPFFLQNTVLFDLNGQMVGYTSNFVTDVPIVTPLTVSSSSVPFTNDASHLWSSHHQHRRAHRSQSPRRVLQHDWQLPS